MKKQFLIFLLGIFVAISFAMTNTDLLSVKPAKHSTLIKVFDFGSSPETVSDFIVLKCKSGYVYKDLVQTRYSSELILIMEKY